MTDEAHLRSSDRVNKQKFLWWAEEYPQKLHQLSLHSAQMSIWCGVANFGVIGPYYFEERDWRTITAISARYVTELRHTRTQLSWNLAFHHMVAARRYDCPCSESIYGGRSGNISGARYYTARGACMACTFTWPLCLRLFLSGLTPSKSDNGQSMISRSQFWRKFQQAENIARRTLGNPRARLKGCVRSGGRVLVVYRKVKLSP
jgi:hypothetical protein